MTAEESKGTVPVSGSRSYMSGIMNDLKEGKFNGTGNSVEMDDEEAIESEGSGESLFGNAEEGESSESQETLPESVPLTELEYAYTDEFGKRQSAKIDLKDHEALKKELSAAKGMRKFQAERDKAMKQLKDIEPEYKELRDSLSLINEAAEKEGLPGVINLLLGQKDGFNKFRQQIIDEHVLRSTGSPTDIEKFELTKKLEEESRKSQQALKALNDREQAAKKAAEDAELRKTEAILHPTFNKVRFAGKLGDAGVEKQLDAAVWQEAMNRLSKSGTDELTQELVDSVFEEVAGAFGKVISKQAETKVAEKIQNKKIDAATKVAAAAQSGTTKSKKEADIREAAQKGNMIRALRAAFSK